MSYTHTHTLHRVMRATQKAGVPIPALLSLCEDERCVSGEREKEKTDLKFITHDTFAFNTPQSFLPSSAKLNISK